MLWIRPDQRARKAISLGEIVQVDEPFIVGAVLEKADTGEAKVQRGPHQIASPLPADGDINSPSCRMRAPLASAADEVVPGRAANSRGNNQRET